MMRRQSYEEGIALVVAVLAIVMVGALVFGVTTIVLLEHRQNQNTGRMEQAFGVAEQGLSETVVNWQAGTWNGLAILDSGLVSGTTPEGSGTYTGAVRRLNQQMFLLDITGVSARDGARQRLGTFVKLVSADLNIQAAARGGAGGGQATLKGGATLSGRDMVPTGWGGACSNPLTDIPGAEWQNDELVVVEPGAVLDGDPPLVEDPTMTPTDLFDWGGLNYDSLVALANFTIPSPDAAAGQIKPHVSGGTCNTTAWKNWGAPEDPSSPCFDYFPIMYRPGPLTIKNGKGGGQGILLVDGELTIDTDFFFYGIIIAKGEIQLKGDATIYGAVITGGQLQTEPGDVIQYSQCAVNRLESHLADSAAPLRSRGWLQL